MHNHQGFRMRLSTSNTNEVIMVKTQFFFFSLFFSFFHQIFCVISSSISNVGSKTVTYSLTTSYLNNIMFLKSLKIINFKCIYIIFQVIKHNLITIYVVLSNFINFFCQSKKNFSNTKKPS